MKRKSYRIFIDHSGQIQFVERRPEEIRERWKFAAGFVGGCLIWGVTMALASGIFM